MQEVLELREAVRGDLREGVEEGGEFPDVGGGFRGATFFEALDALLDGGNTGGGAGEEGFLQQGAEKDFAAGAGLVHRGEAHLGEVLVGGFLLGRGGGFRGEDDALGEIAGDLVFDILFEAADEQAVDVLRAVVLGVLDRRGVEHVHQTGERFALAVMRGGGEEEQGVRARGEQLGGAGAEGVVALAGAALGDVVGFVDDDDVPPSVFEVGAVFAVLLQGIDRDDRPVVVVEGIVVGRDVAADALEAGKPFTIAVAGERLRIPAGALCNIEHERAGGREELEFQLKWRRRAG